MYFTKVRLSGLSAIDLPIIGALPSDPYILKVADGLGPPEVVVSIADTLNAGGVYQGRRPQGREVVLNISLNPDFKVGQTVSDLRTTLYGMLTPGPDDSILVQIMNGDAVLMQTVGYVKKLEIVPFTSDPEVQLTIACPKQYFEAPEIMYVSPGAQATPIITNVGTAPTGFHIEFEITGGPQSLALIDARGNKMEVVYNFAVGDLLKFDTRPGIRDISLVRAMANINLIHALTPQSKWHMLHAGDNAFTTSTQEFTWGSVYYTPVYWGI